MKPFLVITGMHRSGTSFLARALNLGGVNLGNLDSLLSHEWKYFEDNLRGHWENKKIYELTEKTLEQSGGSWEKIPKKTVLPKKMQTQVRKIITELYNFPSFACGFKDPRILVCLDSWIKCLPKNFIIVGIFRDPLKVAESLKHRNNFDYEKSIELWKVYNEKLLLYLEKHDGFLLNFDWSKKKLLDEIKLILAKLGLDKEIDLTEWYSSDLFHSDKTFKSKYPLPKDVRTILTSLKKRTKKNSRVKIKNLSYSKAELSKSMHGVLTQIQNQGKYFTKELDERFTSVKELEVTAKQKDAKILEMQKEFDERSIWAKELEVTAKQKAEKILELQKEFDARSIWVKELEVTAKQKDAKILELQKEFDERAKWAKELEATAQQKTENISNLENEIKVKTETLSKISEEKKSLSEKSKTEINNMHKALQTREAELEKIQNELYEKNFELDQINRSIIYSIFKTFTKKLDKDFPKGTKRGEALRLVRMAYLINKNEGTRALFSAFVEKEKGKKFFGIPSPMRSRKPRRGKSNLLESQQTKNFVITATQKESFPDSSLRKFLQTSSANITKISSFPKVSIIITTLNQVHLLQKNLESIKTKSTYKNYEIIIVTNNKDPNSEMRKFLATVDCSVYIYEDDYSFAGMNNLGASKASGEFLLFLNDDVEILSPNWIEGFLSLALHDDVGAVGGKQLFSNGKLQEAGCIVWKKGNAWNYGRNDNSDDPKFNYVRNVDYCSGSCLFVDKKIFDQIGGFDTSYEPAYSEDVDLCFSIRKLGYRVLYQPLSILIHHEGMSQGTNLDAGIKSYQTINQRRFSKKWQNSLESHLDDSISNSFFERNRKNGLNILYIDHYIPEPDKDSGSLRTFNIMGILAHLDNNITFWPDNLHVSQPYTTELQQKGIEVIYGHQDFNRFLDERKDLYDVAILARPDVAVKFIDSIKSKSPNCRIIYDTTDLHFLRMKRQASIDHSIDENKVKKMHDTEMYLMEKSDLTILTSKAEEKILHKENESLKFAILPNIHIETIDSPSFNERKNMMFVGGFQHTPNIDAVQYLVKDIFPIIKQKLSDVKLYIVGSNPPQDVKELESEDIIVTGYVRDIEKYFRECKVMLSPLRYGAGVKGKITHSLSFGLPVVTNTIGAEGIDLIDGQNSMITDSTKEFAEKAIKLYTDEKLWNNLSENSLKLADQYSPERAREVLMNIIS